MTHRWRFRSASSKLAIVVIGVAFILLCALPLALLHFELGYLLATVLSALIVVFAARTFRGENESLEPREWWRMTAAPSSAYILGALFLAQAVTTVIALALGSAPGIAWVGVGVGVCIAGAYLFSAVRQSLSGARLRT